MKENDIVCGIHYSALHLNSVYNNGIKFDCDKSEKIQSRTVSLPMNEDLKEDDINYIINKVRRNL